MALALARSENARMRQLSACLLVDDLLPLLPRSELMPPLRGLAADSSTVVPLELVGRLAWSYGKLNKVARLLLRETIDSITPTLREAKLGLFQVAAGLSWHAPKVDRWAKSWLEDRIRDGDELERLAMGFVLAWRYRRLGKWGRHLLAELVEHSEDAVRSPIARVLRAMHVAGLLDRSGAALFQSGLAELAPLPSRTLPRLSGQTGLALSLCASPIHRGVWGQYLTRFSVPLLSRHQGISMQESISAFVW
jgi:hypothetical protein